jgi:probable rRNA maturation factor
MIEVLNLQHRYSVNRAKLRRLLVALVKRYELEAPEISLSLVTAKTIKKLNRKFLKKDAPTDVLSFPVRKKGPDGKFYLGDIIISVPQAFKQCLAQAHGLENELEHLTIHAFLHLLGYDHGRGIEEEEEKVHRLIEEE